jgi:hypothetical protein
MGGCRCPVPTCSRSRRGPSIPSPRDETREGDAHFLLRHHDPVLPSFREVQGLVIKKGLVDDKIAEAVTKHLLLLEPAEIEDAPERFPENPVGENIIGDPLVLGLPEDPAFFQGGHESMILSWGIAVSL